MKNCIKSIFIIILISIFIYAFSSSYTSHSIENLAYVVAMGIDKSDNDTDKMKVSFQFIKIAALSDSSSSGESDTVLAEVYADSIHNAINLMNTYIGKEVNLTHCDVIVFSEDFAKDGLSTEIYSLMNNEQLRPSTNIVICKDNASAYIESSKPNIEKIVTKYYDTFSITSAFTGFSQDISLGKFYNNLSCSTCNNTAILGETISEEDSPSSVGIKGERGTQNVGIAVFKKDSLVGKLSPLETICHLLITNDIKSCIISFPYEQSENKIIDLSLSPSKKTKISVDTSKEFPDIKIELYASANILTIDNNSDYTNPTELEKISSSAEKYLNEIVSNYLSKISKELNSDIDGFAKYAVTHFLTTDDWNNYKWDEKFKDSTFSVNANVNVSSSLLLTKQK